jgi:hypothetical protein
MRTQDAIALVGRRLLNHSGTPGGLFYIYIRSFSFYPRSLLTLVRTSLMNPQTRQQMLGGGGGGQGARHMWLVGGGGRKCTRWLPTSCLQRGCGSKLRTVCRGLAIPCGAASRHTHAPLTSQQSVIYNDDNVFYLSFTERECCLLVLNLVSSTLAILSALSLPQEPWNLWSQEEEVVVGEGEVVLVVEKQVY